MAAVFTSVVVADSIVSIVVAIRSVMDGDYLNALIHGAFAVVGIIGVCRWYKVSYHVTVSGGKGTVSFDGEGDEETTKLYRVMSEEEYESVVSNGKFVSYERAMEEKWFATTQDDAIKWANIFYPDGKYKMLEMTINMDYLQKMYYSHHLDNIGPAYCLSLEVLEKAIKAITEVK